MISLVSPCFGLTRLLAALIALFWLCWLRFALGLFWIGAVCFWLGLSPVWLVLVRLAFLLGITLCLLGPPCFDLACFWALFCLCCLGLARGDFGTTCFVVVRLVLLDFVILVWLAMVGFGSLHFGLCRFVVAWLALF